MKWSNNSTTNHKCRQYLRKTGWSIIFHLRDEATRWGVLAIVLDLVSWRCTLQQWTGVER